MIECLEPAKPKGPKQPLSDQSADLKSSLKSSISVMGRRSRHWPWPLTPWLSRIRIEIAIPRAVLYCEDGSCQGSCGESLVFFAGAVKKKRRATQHDTYGIIILLDWLHPLGPIKVLTFIMKRTFNFTSGREAVVGFINVYATPCRV